MNKHFVCLLLLGPALIPAFMSRTATAQTRDDFPSSIIRAVESGDAGAFAAFFVPALRESEKSAFLSRTVKEALDSVRARLAGEMSKGPDRRQIVLQVLFHNAYAAAVEIWQLDCVAANGRWLIDRRTVSGSIRNLYKVGLPLDLAERAASVAIDHEDIRMSFEDAAVFYDNVPGLDTALLVIGRGRVEFNPSNPGERHQLELRYKTATLKDELKSVFIRCSNSFFREHIKIRPAGGKAVRPVSPLEKAEASAIFQKVYPRTFTIQISMTGERLSFLPQSNEAAFEMRGVRTGELTYIYSPFADEEVSLFDREANRVINLYSPGAPEGSGARRLFVSLEDRFDVQDYDIELDFRPAQQYLSAKARVVITPLSASLDMLKFRLSPDLEILRVLDGDKRDLFYTTDKLRKFIYIYFAERPAVKKPAAIEIIYRGKLLPIPPTMDVCSPSPPAEGRYVRFPAPETWFYSHSSFWYPQPAEDDFYTSRLKIIVPPDFACVSNGELVDSGRLKDMDEVVEIEKMGSSFYLFQSRVPVKYLAFIVGKFSRVEAGTDPVPVECLASSDIAEPKKAYCGEAADILRAYEEWFGPFPFARLSIVQRLWPEAGGHSPASFILINESPLKQDRQFLKGFKSPVDLSRWKEYFLAHEIAHQWWGQGVTWSTYRDLWLSEGLAQFAAVYYLGRRYGDATFAAILEKLAQWAVKKSDAGPITLGSRLSFMDYDAYQAIVYDKSALVLNMLRELVGDGPFFAGLRAFFAEREHGSARTGQFREAMEKSSGLDLEAFFSGWFYSYDLPDVGVSWSEEKTAGGDVLAVKVRQSSKTFIFPLWIQWQSGGRVFREKLIVDAPAKEFAVKLAGRPSKIRVNPDSAVPGIFR